MKVRLFSDWASSSTLLEEIFGRSLFDPIVSGVEFMDGGDVLLCRADCDDGAQRAAGRGIARAVGFFDGIRSVAGGDCAGGDDLLLAAIGAV